MKFAQLCFVCSLIGENSCLLELFNIETEVSLHGFLSISPSELVYRMTSLFEIKWETEWEDHLHAVELICVACALNLCKRERKEKKRK